MHDRMKSHQSLDTTIIIVFKAQNTMENLGFFLENLSISLEVSATFIYGNNVLVSQKDTHN